MISKNTIVSSFLTNVNSIYPVEKYLKDGIIMLQAKIPKIIFIEDNLYEQVKIYINEHTIIIPIKKSDWYFKDYKESIINFDLNTNNKTKDTLDFIFTMCNKTEWIKKATELNYFNTDSFTWIDFGIRYIFKNDSDETFIQKIENLNNKVYDNVRIASIWNLNKKYNYDIYKDIHWYFAGGVFGGNKDKLIVFADKTKEMCLQVIEEKKTLIWEVNIWYLVYLKNPELFFAYPADHNASIIVNY